MKVASTPKSRLSDWKLLVNWFGTRQQRCQGSEGVLLSKVAGTAPDPQPWRSLQVKITSNGKLGVGILGTAAVGSEVNISTPTSLPFDRWVHVGYAVDADRAAISLVVDGRAAQTAPIPALLCNPKARTVEQIIIIETEHDYADNSDVYWPVSVPNAFKYEVVFDPRSST